VLLLSLQTTTNARGEPTAEVGSISFIYLSFIHCCSIVAEPLLKMFKDSWE